MYHFKRIFLVQLVNMQNSPLFYDAKTYALHNYWIMSNKKLEETDWQVALPKERSQFKAFNCSFSSTSYVAWHLSCICIQVTWQWLPHQIVYEKLAVPILGTAHLYHAMLIHYFDISSRCNFFLLFFFFCKFERRDPVKVWWIQVLSRIY